MKTRIVNARLAVISVSILFTFLTACGGIGGDSSTGNNGGLTTDNVLPVNKSSG